MRSLIEFIAVNKHWFVFVLLEAQSLCLLFQMNNYQGSAYLTTANGFVGAVYETTSGITSFFNLKSRNHRLEAENELLREELLAFKEKHHIDSRRSRDKLFRVIGADVINASLHKGNNLMTINKGFADGVRNEMGVICSSGVVGIVSLVSRHYAVVMPIINVKSMVSCRLSKSHFFGTMQWKMGDTEVAEVTGVPRHADVKVGEIVETNGFSDIFPAGIPIGEVVKVDDSSDGLSYMLTVKLYTDFSCLRDVSVITNYHHAERRRLEQKADSLQSL